MTRQNFRINELYASLARANQGDSAPLTWRTLSACSVETHLDACPYLPENFHPSRQLWRMAPHRRRLPHIYPEGSALFLTWHLHGSMPASLLPPPGPLSSGQAFVWLDRHLDSTRRGPKYLKQPEIAKIVVRLIRNGVDLGHYELAAYVVMANHVHMLIWPKIAPDQLLQSLKGAAAREANRVLGRTGESFWQKDSYDHWVRTPAEFERIRAYIENNPVRAGLVQEPRDFPWSSAGVEMSLDAAR